MVCEWSVTNWSEFKVFQVTKAEFFSMENYFYLFEEFGDSQKKYTCSVTKNEFLIYVFPKEGIDLLKELDEINSLTKKHSLPEFCVVRYRKEDDFDDDFEEVFVFKCQMKKRIKMSAEFVLCYKLFNNFDCI